MSEDARVEAAAHTMFDVHRSFYHESLLPITAPWERSHEVVRDVYRAMASAALEADDAVRAVGVSRDDLLRLCELAAPAMGDYWDDDDLEFVQRMEVLGGKKQ